MKTSAFSRLSKRRVLLTLCGLLLAQPIYAVPPAPTIPIRHQVDGPAFLRIASEPAAGDLDAIWRRGFLRVLVVANKTHYLVDRGRQFGISYDMVAAFEQALNAVRPKQQKRPLVAVFIPVHRDELLKRLQENRGDIAVANLTDTAERERLVDFSQPFIDNVREILVSGPASAPLSSLDDLAGKAVYVRRSSSFHSHLLALNQDFAVRILPPIRIQPAEEHLEAEDLLEMLNAGLIQYTIVDQHIGEFWAPIFEQVRLHPDLAVASGQKIAWALRKGTPQLKEQVDRFMVRNRIGSFTGNDIYRRYLKNTKWAKYAVHEQEIARFNRTIDYFRKYCDAYQFDPLMLAAQGYQESGLDQSRESQVGAIGVMQVMPATGRDLMVGDIHQEEANIHAGIKYMRRLVDTSFDEPGIDDFNRTLFAFAAYNAGPTRVASLRREAAQRGLDPNQWFQHVETIAAIRIGRETIQYVANIAKYFIAYKLIEAQHKDGLRSEKD
jgi:membrane-bound lytic murein transglycosylase MltF